MWITALKKWIRALPILAHICRLTKLLNEGQFPCLILLSLLYISLPYIAVITVYFSALYCCHYCIFPCLILLSLLYISLPYIAVITVYFLIHIQLNIPSNRGLYFFLSFHHNFLSSPHFLWSLLDLLVQPG